MKRIFLFTVLFFATIFTFAQTNFDLVLNQHSADANLVKKLKEFRAQGIERSLDVSGVSPQQLIDTAKSYEGTSHVMGGTSHSGIDCSGLLYVSLKSLGFNVPHNSQEIARYGKIIVDTDSLQAGDLVFFVKTYNTRKVITHSGIYIKNGKFIHTSAKRGVIISDLSSNYYKKHYIFSTRLWAATNQETIDEEKTDEKKIKKQNSELEK